MFSDYIHRHLLSVIKIRITIILSISFVITTGTISHHTLTYPQTEGGTNLVHADQRNAADTVFAFISQNMVINVGESITLDNPNFYAEPHSISILNEVNYFLEFVTTFNVIDSAEYQPSDPESSADSFFISTYPSQTTKTVVMVKTRALIPMVIVSHGGNITYLESDSNYIMYDNENLVNS